MTHDSPTVGVLGTGFVTDVFHMPCFKQLGVDVIAVGARSEETGKEFAKKWRIKKAYGGENAIEGLCEDDDVNIRLRWACSAR